MIKNQAERKTRLGMNYNNRGLGFKTLSHISFKVLNYLTSLISSSCLIAGPKSSVDLRLKGRGEQTCIDSSETLVSSHLFPFLSEFQIMIVLQNQTLQPLAAGSGLIQSKNGIIGKTWAPLQGPLRHHSAGAALCSEPPTHGSQKGHTFAQRRTIFIWNVKVDSTQRCFWKVILP